MSGDNDSPPRVWMLELRSDKSNAPDRSNSLCGVPDDVFHKVRQKHNNNHQEYNDNSAIQDFSNERITALGVHLPQYNKVIIIPTKSDEVYRVIVEINVLSRDFWEGIHDVFYRNRIRTIYSSSALFTREGCRWEGYIDKREIDENGSDISHIINELREIDGVGDVTVNMLSLEKLL